MSIPWWQVEWAEGLEAKQITPNVITYGASIIRASIGTCEKGLHWPEELREPEITPNVIAYSSCSGVSVMRQ